MGKMNSKKQIIHPITKLRKFDSSILYFNYLKILIIGDSKTGKTNFIEYFLNKTYLSSILIYDLIR